MLAMSLPSAARALGLGELRVDSALNEPLSAQIDIVGATRDELMALTAKVAAREVFQRYGADRPSFLASATFKVGLDARGRPVLNVRSGEAFTDPVINFLVELRWSNGQLVREYSLLLDPAGFAAAPRAGAAAIVSDAARRPPAMTAAAGTPPAGTVPATPAAPITQPVNASPLMAPGAARAETPANRVREASRSAQRGATHHRVAARDTLRGIARRAGARSESRAQRLMIAIYRANPHAFEGNINRLHRGALLSIPSTEDAEAMDAADAKREFHAQMTAWRLDGRPGAPHRVAASVAVATPAPIAFPGPSVAPLPAPDPANDALKGRVQSLEKALDDMHRQLRQLTAGTPAAPAEAAPAPAPLPAGVPSASAMPPGAAVLPGSVVPPASAVLPGSVVPPTSAVPPISTVRVEVLHAPGPAALIPAATAADPVQTMSSQSVLGSMAVALAALLAGFAYVRRKFMRARAAAKDAPVIQDHVEASPVTLDEPALAGPRTPGPVNAAPPSAPLAPPAAETPLSEAGDETTQSMAIDAEALERSYLDLGVDSLGIDSGDTAAHPAAGDDMADDTAANPMMAIDADAQDTATLEASMLETVVIHTAELGSAAGEAGHDTPAIDAKKLPPAVNTTVLDYNLLDLDATVQHVQMPSQLHDHVVVSERRTNIVDVLKSAIDRDPQRRDLRMKLLETYYSTAATNQRAFRDVVRKLAQEPEFLTPDDWKKVAMMGREIAVDDTLFADLSEAGDLADCA
jgi:FimV-like protein